MRVRDENETLKFFKVTFYSHLQVGGIYQYTADFKYCCQPPW